MRMFLLSLLLLSGQSSYAALQQEIVPYYGEEFYNDLAQGVRDEELKDRLKKILQSYHKANPGSLDQVVDSCSGQGCYSQESLGYDGARVYLMGNYYLHRKGNSYAVVDVYCDSEKTAEDFRGGTPPGPDVVPDHTVINIEHTWPQSRFTGRHNRGTQKADLHHLFPTDSELNAIRGNNSFGEVVKDKKELKCAASRFGYPEKSNRVVFEPPNNHKGNVARALFYFSIRYDVQLNLSEEETLREWSKADPVDEDEAHRNNEIYKVQKNRNPFVDFPELVDHISHF